MNPFYPTLDFAFFILEGTIVKRISCKMAAAKKQYFLRFLY